MPAISFFEEDINYKLKNKALVRQWIKDTIVAEGFKLKELNYIFCSDAYLLAINQQYLNHDTYTDIITFDYSKENNQLPISGDIFISIERVKENALKYSGSFENELNRIIIHGILHLLGHKDKTKADKSEMTKQEENCLKLLKKLNG